MAALLKSKDEQLFRASLRGDLNAVMDLCGDPSVQVNFQTESGLTALYGATTKNHPSIVEYLLKHPKLDPNMDRSPVLFVACQEGYKEIVALLVADSRVEVNKPMKGGWAPVHIASYRGHTEIVALLLGNPRLDPNYSVEGKFTALALASSQGRKDVVVLLLADPRVDVNLAPKGTSTPLCSAAGAGHMSVVEILANDARVDLLKTDDAGLSPVESAFHNQKIAVGRFLLKTRRSHTPSLFYHMPTHPILIIDAGEEKLKIFVKDDFEMVKRGPKAAASFLTWVNVLCRLFLDPETRQEALEALLLQELFKIVDSGTSEPQVLNKILWYIEIFSRVDFLKKAVHSVGGYQKVATMFTQGTPKVKDELAVPFRNLLSKGADIRRDVALGHPDLPESLHDYAKNSATDKLAAYCILLILAPFFSKADEAKNLTKEAVFAAISGDNKDKRNLALDCLMEAAAMPEVRPFLLHIGVKELVLPFAEDVKSEANFVAVLIIALLSASDVSANSETGTLPTAPGIIKRIIQALETFSNTSDTSITTLPGYTVRCKQIMIATRSLATNEANLKELKTQGVVSVIEKLLKVRRQDLFLDNLDTLQEATYVVWALSFNKDCREQLLASEMVSILKSFPTEQEGVKHGIDGALWNLGESSRPTPAVQQGDGGKPGHIMISYSWGQQERMRQLASVIKEAGFPIWIDVEEMEGSVLEKMAEAVEEAAIIVIGLSTTYKDSQACHTEAEYSYKLKKPMIFVLAEDGFVAKGWLGAMLGDQLWYSPWTHKEGFESGAADLIKVLEKRASGVRAPPGSITSRSASDLSKAPTRTLSTGLGISSSSSFLLPKPSYSEVKVPECGDPLPASMLTREKMLSWTVQDVCRWLKMKKLDELLVPCVFHKIDGVALRAVNPERSANTIEILKAMGLTEVGLALKFHFYLSELLASAATK